MSGQGPSGSGSAGDPYASVSVSPDPGFALNFERMEAIEQLGRPFLINLEVSSTQSKSQLLTLLGSSVTVTLKGGVNGTRYYNGILSRIVYTGLSGGAARYHLELRPWIWVLSRTQDCRIFQNMSVFDIIRQVFSGAGFTDFADKRQAQAGSQTLDFCVQYRETSLDFVTRLMEQYGIYYFFTHENGKHTLNFADDPKSHTAVTPAIPRMAQMTEFRAMADHVWSFNADWRLQPGKTSARDYNFTTPSADLTVRSVHPPGHPYDSGEIYDYPGLYGVTADGQKLADVRNQDYAARRLIFTGTTNSRQVTHGAKITLSGSKVTELNTEYLVIATTSTYGQGESTSSSSGELTDSLNCEFDAILATTPFRLDCETPLPLIRGPQTAKVVGKPGDEITTDNYGRVKIKFYWDRISPDDDTASCWVRVAQIWAGNSFGGMFMPRVGQEVIVEFLEGNPDRPIITGRVYNATQVVPYALPDNATRSTIKSSSSKGNNGYNELRFEDKAGAEEVFFQAQKDYTKQVLHNETVTITQDTTTTVSKGNRSVTVSQGNDTHVVSKGDRSVTISAGNDTHKVNKTLSVTVDTGDHTTEVSAGNHSLKVDAGTSTIQAGQSITLKVGGNSITIDTTGITITAAKISVQAQSQLSAQGAVVQINASGAMTLQGSVININ